MRNVLCAFAAGVLLAGCGPRELQPDEDFVCERCEAWNEPIDSLRILGNTWYVGTDGLTSLLIEAGDGLILVDGGLPQSAPRIVDNVRAIGHDPADIRAILVSHAHFDHAGGINALQRLTGATVYSSTAGAAVLTSGRLQEDDPQFAYGRRTHRFRLSEMLFLWPIVIRSPLATSPLPQSTRLAILRAV